MSLKNPLLCAFRVWPNASFLSSWSGLREKLLISSWCVAVSTAAKNRHPSVDRFKTWWKFLRQTVVYWNVDFLLDVHHSQASFNCTVLLPQQTAVFWFLLFELCSPNTLKNFLQTSSVGDWTPLPLLARSKVESFIFLQNLVRVWLHQETRRMYARYKFYFPECLYLRRADCNFVHAMVNCLFYDSIFSLDCSASKYVLFLFFAHQFSWLSPPLHFLLSISILLRRLKSLFNSWSLMNW